MPRRRTITLPCNLPIIRKIWLSEFRKSLRKGLKLEDRPLQPYYSEENALIYISFAIECVYIAVKRWLYDNKAAVNTPLYDVIAEHIRILEGKESEERSKNVLLMLIYVYSNVLLNYGYLVRDYSKRNVISYVPSDLAILNQRPIDVFYSIYYFSILKMQLNDIGYTENYEMQVAVTIHDQRKGNRQSTIVKKFEFTNNTFEVDLSNFILPALEDQHFYGYSVLVNQIYLPKPSISLSRVTHLGSTASHRFMFDGETFGYYDFLDKLMINQDDIRNFVVKYSASQYYKFTSQDLDMGCLSGPSTALTVPTPYKLYFKGNLYHPYTFARIWGNRPEDPINWSEFNSNDSSSILDSIKDFDSLLENAVRHPMRLVDSKKYGVSLQAVLHQFNIPDLYYYIFLESYADISEGFATADEFIAALDEDVDSHTRTIINLFFHELDSYSHDFAEDLIKAYRVIEFAMRRWTVEEDGRDVFHRTEWFYAESVKTLYFNRLLVLFIFHFVHKLNRFMKLSVSIHITEKYLTYSETSSSQEEGQNDDHQFWKYGFRSSIPETLSTIIGESFSNSNDIVQVGFKFYILK